MNAKKMPLSIPNVIQGGMGIGVSGYKLANAVARAGGLGVVSGTAIDTVLVRRLAEPDLSDETMAALRLFPFPRLAEDITRPLLHAEGTKGARYRLLSLPGMTMSFERQLVMVLSSFVEVTLAKLGHGEQVGMNLLEKIQLPTLPTLFGAMLARVDVVLMGAGVPSAIPRVLDELACWKDVSLALHVEGAQNAKEFTTAFSPRAFYDQCRERELALGGSADASPELRRPAFLAIVSSDILARRLQKVAGGGIDGFVVEHHSAGGHNAPPRRPGPDGNHNELDEPKLDVFRSLDVPFWLAGGLASVNSLERAHELGARGIQVGTAFAFCAESGITSALKERVLAGLRKGTIQVETDKRASPTGYPFKVVVDGERPEEREAQRARARVCDLGYLRQTYLDENGRVGFRCPGEPVETFVKKGGARELSEGKLCLCNQLLATVGLGQIRPDEAELPLMTAGSELNQLLQFVEDGEHSYTAERVMSWLLSEETPMTLRSGYGDLHSAAIA